MANTKSAIKRIRTSAKRHERNVAVKSATRTFVKKARQTIAATPAEAKDDITAAISALDRAARKGIIHPNNAARRKSRLIKRSNAAEAALATAAAEPEVTVPKPKRRAATAKGKAAAKKTAKTTAATAPEGAEAEKPKRATRARKPKAE